jgi:hypothetical protein
MSAAPELEELAGLSGHGGGLWGWIVPRMAVNEEVRPYL